MGQESDITQVATAPLTEAESADVATVTTHPLPPAAPNADEPMSVPTQPLGPDPARQVTLRLVLRGGLSRALTRPLTRLALVYRAATYPLVSLTRNPAIVVRRTLRLRTHPSMMMRLAEQRRRRMRLLWSGLVLMALGLLVIILALLHRH